MYFPEKPIEIMIPSAAGVVVVSGVEFSIPVAPRTRTS